MSLSDVQARLIFNPSVTSANEAIIRSTVEAIYEGSAAGAALLERLVTNNRTVTFNYIAGAIQTDWAQTLPPPTNATIDIDTEVVTSISFITETGAVVPFSLERAIAHELVHAIDRTEDMTYTNPAHPQQIPIGDYSFGYNGQDLIGSTVTLENLIMSQLGETQSRLTYPGSAIQSVFDSIGMDNQLIPENAHIDTAIVAQPLPGDSQNLINTTDLYQTIDTTSDLVVGSSDPEFIVTGAMNDYIYDLGGADVLEGGSGDDIYYLSDDSTMDVVIVGQGSDRIFGGGVDDRLVIRTDQLELNPDPQYASWSSPATGVSEHTKALPLLGGFTATSGETHYAYVVDQVGRHGPVYKPEDPNEYYIYSIDHTGNPLLSQYVNVNVTGGGYVQMQGSFDIVYSQYVAGGVNFLDITLNYWSGGSYVSEKVATVFDFQEGDFGIQFEAQSTFDVPNDAAINPGGTLYYNGNATHVAYINNNGAYITVPEVPGSPPPAPAPLVQGGDDVAERSATPMHSSELPIPFGHQVADLQYADLGSFPRLSIQANGADWQFAWQEASNQSYVSSFVEQNWIDELGTLVPLSPDGLWFEPEPIGGLV